MNKSIKVRDLYKERAKYSDIEPVEMVDIDDEVDTWYGMSSMVITEKQVEELKNGKAIYFTDGEYGNVIVLDKRLIEQEPCEMTVDEYRQRMIQAFHNADCDELIAICAHPTENEFEHLEWLLKNHYKKEIS